MVIVVITTYFWYSNSMTQTQHNKPHESTPKQINFNPNPFGLAFNAMTEAFKINQNPAIVIIVGAIIIGVTNQIGGYIPDLLRMLTSDSSDNTKSAVTAIGGLFSIAFFIITMIVSVVWSGFLGFLGIKNAKGISVAIGQCVKAGLAKFWTILGISLFIGVLVFACLIPAIILAVSGGVLLAMEQEGVSAGIFIASGLLLIGGIVFAIRLSLARSLSIYIALDENLGAFESMRRSVTLTKNRLIEAWGMTFPGYIVPIVGPVLTSCGIGSYYLQLKVYRDNSVELPKVHILSWLPLMALIGIAGILVIGAATIALVLAAR